MHEHPTRQPHWGMSVYTDFGLIFPDEGSKRVAKGAHPPASTCPCGEVFTASALASNHAECSTCETFECPRCERWCSWEMGCADDAPALCDDCMSQLGLSAEQSAPARSES